ncbi:hypothetical protein [Fournierella massiliensis]|uniref:hypothetical protein n=1 Tax=Allofournierella massiliensis TaxID=1650663 RepID=UPI00351F9C85
MLKIRAVVSALLVFLLLSAFAICAFAVDEETEVRGNQYFKFVPAIERIDSRGNFTFQVNSQLTSDSFKVKSNSTEITVRAGIKNEAGVDLTQNHPNHVFTVVLYQKGFPFPKKMNTGTFYADNLSHSFETIGLSTDKEYYLVITNSMNLSGGVYVQGNGSISNFAGVA